MSYDDDLKLDPRIAGMEPGESRELVPSPERLPTIGESRFLIPQYDPPQGRFVWENEPQDYRHGQGRGLPPMTELPRFRSGSSKHPSRHIDLADHHFFFLMSQRMVDLLREVDPASVEAHVADYRYANGVLPDQPMYLADIVRILDVADLSRSAVSYTRNFAFLDPALFEGRCMYGARPPMALTDDIPENVHAFCLGSRGHSTGWPLFLSRALVAEMIKRRFVRLRFHDPADDANNPQANFVLWANGNGTGKPR